MAYMRLADISLKNYVRENKLSDLYEALLSGLAIMCPDNPYKFLIEKLQYIQENGSENLTWDMFIDEDMRPPQRFLQQNNLFDMFDSDEMGGMYKLNQRKFLQPTSALFVKAYGHYNRQLLSTGFCAFKKYYLYQKLKKIKTAERLQMVVNYRRLRIFRKVFDTWKHWVEFRKGRQAVAYNMLQHIYNVSVCKMVFVAWNSITQNSKKTREYFERLERGEKVDEDGDGEYGDGEARDDISLLPNRIAIKIFSHLGIRDLCRSSRVCRSWKMLTQNSLLLSNLDLSTASSSMTDKVVTKLLSRCRPFLVHCNLRACSLIGVETFYALRECRNLQDLNLSEVLVLNDNLLSLVTEGCKILLYLNVSFSNITDVSLRNIAQNLPNLQYLSLMFCKKITDKGLSYLALGKGAKRLCYIDLSNCDQISADGYEALFSGCKGLQHVILNDLPNLDDNCLQHMNKNCNKLNSLSFLGSTNITDVSIRKFSANKKLNWLKIESNIHITDASFKTIGKNCTELRHLYLVDCPNITDLSLKLLMFCALTVLNLSSCVRITDNGIKLLMDGSCGLRLHELNISNCDRITDLSILNIQKRGRSLAYLNLGFCENITEAGLELVGQIHSLVSIDLSGCSCTDQCLSSLGSNLRLKYVSASQCSSVTDLGLQKLSQQCVLLERLDISHCKLLTDGSIKTMAFCCRMLMHLNISGCKMLTDLSIQYLSGVCRYLRHLDISGCYQITDKSLKYLKDGCTSLDSLNMLYCSNITRNGANRISRIVPHVEYSSDPVPEMFDY